MGQKATARPNRITLVAPRASEYAMRDGYLKTLVRFPSLAIQTVFHNSTFRYPVFPVFLIVRRGFLGVPVLCRCF